jgi:hypothetical protein
VGVAEGNGSNFGALAAADPHRSQRRAHGGDDGIGVELPQGVHPIAGQGEKRAAVVAVEGMRFVDCGVDGGLA